jgi:hypothetical protein
MVDVHRKNAEAAHGKTGRVHPLPVDAVIGHDLLQDAERRLQCRL